MVAQVWSLDVGRIAAGLPTGWVQNTAAAKWAPRAGHFSAYSPQEGQVIIVGGEEYVSPSPSPSPLKLANAVTLAAANTLLRTSEVRDWQEC